MHQPGGDTLHLRIKVGSKTGGEEQSLCPGGGGGAPLWEAGGAPLWKAGAWAGAWAVQGHQTHLQRSKHNPGKINFQFLVALEIKELKIRLPQLKLFTHAGDLSCKEEASTSEAEGASSCEDSRPAVEPECRQAARS